MDWFDLPPTPAELAEQRQIRGWMTRKLDEQRARLPRLTKAQAEAIVDLLVDAHMEGQYYEGQNSFHTDREKMQERSRKGVLARREKSRRADVVRAFKAAASAGKDVSVEKLALDLGVSRATAYRALQANGRARRPAKKTSPKSRP